VPRGKPGVGVELRESRLLSEYLADRYKGQRIILQPRLGAIAPHLDGVELSAGELRSLGVWRRYPDAVVLMPGRAVIIEASLKPDPGKISLIELYARLFPLTPEFGEYASLPTEKLLVFGVHDHILEAMARDHGVRVEVYQPQWILDWLESLRPRDRRPATMTA
jgi:hypothetical protein